MIWQRKHSTQVSSQSVRCKVLTLVWVIIVRLDSVSWLRLSPVLAAPHEAKCGAKFPICAAKFLVFKAKLFVSTIFHLFAQIWNSGSIQIMLGDIKYIFRQTRRYSPLRKLSSSSCGGLWPSGKKKLFRQFLLILGNFWCLVVTSVTFSSNLSNF